MGEIEEASINMRSRTIFSAKCQKIWTSKWRILTCETSLASLTWCNQTATIGYKHLDSWILFMVKSKFHIKSRDSLDCDISSLFDSHSSDLESGIWVKTSLLHLDLEFEIYFDIVNPFLTGLRIIGISHASSQCEEQKKHNASRENDSSLKLVNNHLYASGYVKITYSWDKRRRSDLSERMSVFIMSFRCVTGLSMAVACLGTNFWTCQLAFDRHHLHTTAYVYICGWGQHVKDMDKTQMLSSPELSPLKMST